MSRRSKERRQDRLRPKTKKGFTYEYAPAMPDELENQKFKHSAKEIKFRGQSLPAYFEIWASETQKLDEGQVIGKTRFGQKLYWKNGSVIARG